ncbi:MAG: NAD(P)H-dependent oxidoreductase [Solirubrobacterales bacterium]|nr:NAD(P)H-dependent oxidoreductase [Solirubrobacterales bacterium]
MKLVVISGGTSDPSSTSMLAGHIAKRVEALADGRVETRMVELRPLAGELATAMVSQLRGPQLEAAIKTLADADALVVATPVYKAGVSGLFKSFFDVLDNDLLIAKPVILAATAGSARHALVIDDQLRALFAYMRAFSVPTSLFASSEDWGDTSLNDRIDRAATELLALTRADVQASVRGDSWRSYQHELGSNAGAEVEIDLDSDMMRLATGGSAT